MNRTSSIILGILVSAFVARNAVAQWNVARFATDPNTAYTSFGLNPALVPSLGYGRVMALFDHDVQFAGDVGVVAANFDTRDFRARLGAQSSIVRWKSLYLTGSATFITRGTDNSIYRGLNFGADFTGALGVFRHGWFTAGEFGFDKAIITHITHSDWYRTYFYPDAKDGWYLDAGGTFHYGLTGGFSLGRQQVVGSFGWRQTENFEPLTPPMYVSLGLGLGF